jgi:hypothetical protein
MDDHQRHWFRVEVSDHAGQIVAIETEMLAGRDIGDVERDTIRKAIDHLSGFIGGPYHAAERIEQLERTLAEAREALRPFANFSSGYGRTARADEWVLVQSATNTRFITMGDVRIAEDFIIKHRPAPTSK